MAGGGGGGGGQSSDGNSRDEGPSVNPGERHFVLDGQTFQIMLLKTTFLPLKRKTSANLRVVRKTSQADSSQR